MTTAPAQLAFAPETLDGLAEVTGRIVALTAGDGLTTPGAQAADAALGGALGRLVAAEDWKGKPGEVATIPFPAGMAADALVLVALGAEPDQAAARKAGAAIARALKGKAATVLAGGLAAETVAEAAFGQALTAYDFSEHKTGEDARKTPAAVTWTCDAPEAVSALAKAHAAVVEGVFFCRDLTNEPANVLTTDDFAARLAAMGELGLEVEILEEPELEALGMRALLGVGRGSESPTKVVVMKWMGGGDEAPLALVGKGVVFDTGGVSLKPAGGMEDMTMDMGGAGVVAGVMRAVALRGAKANVVGLVGLVENMPDGRAQRPGDVVASMKGDTIEIINTDAEGRLVLADVLWYAQETFKPSAMVDLATLTGAVIIALGHHAAGWYANDDGFAAEFAAAAEAEGEAQWRMPLGEKWDKQIKSHIADIKNTGGRQAGSITAAQFLQRFVKKDVPWIHIDIAGVASVKEATEFAPRGATGWGVRALDRLVRSREV